MFITAGWYSLRARCPDRHARALVEREAGAG
jgi:hypothetical protein